MSFGLVDRWGLKVCWILAQREGFLKLVSVSKGLAGFSARVLPAAAFRGLAEESGCVGFLATRLPLASPGVRAASS